MTGERTQKFKQVQVGVAGTSATDLDQRLAGPRFWHRHVPELAWLLPFDELKCLDAGP
jgi:hypothetical protein